MSFKVEALAWFCGFTCAGLYLLLSFPIHLAPVVFFNTCAVVAIGASLTSLAIDQSNPSRSDYVVVGIVSWAVQALLLLAWMSAAFQEVSIASVARLTLPFPFYHVRSVIDVFLIVIGLFALLWCYDRSRARHPSSPRFAAAVLFTIIGFSLKSVRVSDYIALWTPSWSEANKAVGLFDLGNALWLGGLLPVLLFKTDRREGDQNPAGRKSWCWVVALLPFVASVLWRVFIDPSRGPIDQLPAVWWARKAVSLLVWTALYEETLWRVVVLGWLLVGLSSVGVVNARKACGVALATLLFMLGHWGQPWSAVFAAAAVGVCNGIVMVQTRSVGMCVVGHTLTNLVGSSWN